MDCPSNARRVGEYPYRQKHRGTEERDDSYSHHNSQRERRKRSGYDDYDEAYDDYMRDRKRDGESSSRKRNYRDEPESYDEKPYNKKRRSRYDGEEYVEESDLRDSFRQKNQPSKVDHIEYSRNSTSWRKEHSDYQYDTVANTVDRHSYDERPKDYRQGHRDRMMDERRAVADSQAAKEKPTNDSISPVPFTNAPPRDRVVGLSKPNPKQTPSAENYNANVLHSKGKGTAPVVHEIVDSSDEEVDIVEQHQTKAVNRVGKTPSYAARLYSIDQDDDKRAPTSISGDYEKERHVSTRLEGNHSVTTQQIKKTDTQLPRFGPVNPGNTRNIQIVISSQRNSREVRIDRKPHENDRRPLPLQTSDTPTLKQRDSYDHPPHKHMNRQHQSEHNGRNHQRWSRR
eukprot:TRINITY_DN6441_c0_g1_i1.p1 TRINITY_DN6441_c0_g1~~TRINITY_DN6441_c0_g1_i1.p1  ORF type:complete len:399 (+),score=55.33 TRINITY_DN6441_c0_g1_i1:187-1383(+)